MKLILIILSFTLFILNQYHSNAQFSPEQKAKLDSLNLIIEECKHDTSVAHAFVELTEILALSDLDTVIFLCDKAVAIAEKNLADETLPANEKKEFQLVLALAYNNIGTIHFYKGNIQAALDFYNRSIKIKKEIGDKKSLITSFNNLGAIYIHLGESTLALEQFGKAIKASIGIEDDAGKAVALSNIGAIYRERGKISVALKNYNAALKIREKIGDKMGTANSLNNIGTIYKGLGNIPLALDYNHKALKIREGLGDKIGIANSLNNIGLIYFEQNDITSAIDYYDRALKIREEIGDKAGIATSLKNIGAVYKNQDDEQKALEYFQKSLKIEKEIGDKNGIASTLNNIGYIYKQQGDTRLAFDCFQESLSIGRKLGHKMDIIYSLIYTGTISADQGNYTKAIIDGKEALALAQEMGFVKEIEESSKLLYNIYKKTARYKDALKMHELYSEMHDSLLNAENTRAITTQKLNYIHEKEKQVELLDRKLEKRDEAIRQQRKDQLTYTGVGLVLLLSLIGFFVTRSRQRKKELVQQQKINNSFSRFVPIEFLQSLGKGDILEVNLGDQIEDDVTVMFSDIRSYTSLSESMTVDENFKFLNSYFGKIGPVIQKNNGFVNQFLGDGIMALFQNDPEDALKAAIEIQKTVDKYNLERIKENRQPITVGTGIHYGSLMLGIIGDDKRMDAGVVSDAVNTASRVEGLTKYYGASIVLSEKTVKHIKNLEQYNYRYLGKVLVKGKNKTLSVYEFFGGDNQQSIDLKEETKKDFEKALDAYFHRQFAEASVLFKKITELNKKDHTALMYLNQCSKYIVHGPPEDWAGIQRMKSK